MPLKTEAVDRLRAIVDKHCADGKKQIPGATVVVVGKDGNELFAHSAGKRGLASSEDMTLDNIFWIASCTKVITGVACLQAVEKGLLKLDDGEHLEGLLPEVKDLDVLKADGTVEKKNKPITLRMLLTHTAGFGYSFWNQRLRDWSLPAGINELSGRFEDIKAPLTFQPGESWEYGTNIDWAGLALERATGLRLNDYMQENIFKPLGLNNMTMLPNSQQRSKLAYMHSRDETRMLRPCDHLLRLPLVIDPDNKGEAKRVFNSGGAGLFAKPQEYCKFLAVLLNDGTCPRTGVQILHKETVEEMFKNQIPQFPDFGRQGVTSAKLDLMNSVPQLYPVGGDPPQGWGLTFMMANSSATGRSKGTAHWAGLPNLWWWCDRENGVAGMVCTQILPFGDLDVLGLWGEVEATVYQALASNTATDDAT